MKVYLKNGKSFVYKCIQSFINRYSFFFVRSAMNKTLGLILSILFIFEIFLIGIPLTTTQATTLPPLNNGIAVYLPNYNTTVFVFNVNNITLSKTNVSVLASAFYNYFEVSLNFNGTIYKLPLYYVSNANKYDVYFAYNPTTNKIEYVIILAYVIGKYLSSGITVRASDVLQELGITNLAITNEFETPTPVTELNSTNIVYAAFQNKIIPQSVCNDLQNPQNTAPYFFYEHVAGYISGTISLYSVSIPAGYTTNYVLVFAPLSFIPPGFFNPLQQSGALGSKLQSVASTRPYIWGRALINTSIIDPFISSGTEPLLFQLNYSTSGALQINMAQVAWISAITNFPSSLTYLSYNFSNGYVSFIGIITGGDNATVEINGVPVPSPISGATVLNISDPTYQYNISLIAITPLAKKNGTVIQYVSNLTYYYYNGISQQPVLGQFYYYNGTTKTYTPTLPVYGYYAPPGSKITITGTFNGVTKTITITIGSTPSITVYTSYVSLYASAYEIVPAQFTGYVTHSGILSTPPTTITLKGTTQFQVVANMTAEYETSNVTLLTNATLTFSKVYLNYVSFNGIIVTPAYPFINGTTAMQYLVTSEYQQIGQNYETEILGSQIEMTTGTMYGLLNLLYSQNLGYFTTTISVPSSELSTGYAVQTGSGPMQLEFTTALPQESYEMMVELGIWNNETVVSVSAYDLFYEVPTKNTASFYAIIIPPRIITSAVTPQSFICGNAPYVEIYDPDAILVPGNPTGNFTYAIISSPQYGVYISVPTSPSTAVSVPLTYPSWYHVQQLAVIAYSGNVYYYTYNPTYNEWMLNLNATFTEVNGELQVYLVKNGGIYGPYNVYANNASEIVNLQYYADNNPTVNFYFEQTSPSLMSLYLAGLNVSYSNILLSPEKQIGYIELTPTNAYYNITNYVTFTGHSSLEVVGANTLKATTPVSSFVGATVYYKYVSTDYAVYHDFMKTGQYMVQAQITVPNVTAKLYFANSITPLYATATQLYYYEPYYAEKTSAYLSIGTGGQLTLYPKNLDLAKILNVSVTLSNGNMYTIALTTKNITTLFVSLIAQQLQYCNGTYEFEISIPGLESILGLNAQQLNGSTLTVSVYDYVTHETLVASTKLVALKELTLVKAQPGKVFYFLTFKASTVTLTASTPWFIATSMYKEPALHLTDYEYAHTNPTSILHLTIDSITVYHNGYKAMVYYNATSGRTIAINVYGKVVANYSGNLLPTISETDADSGMFNGTLPFKIIPNTTVTSLTLSGISLYTNGTLAIMLSNGSVVPLGPAGLFVLPILTYQGKLIGYNANVSVTVSDPVTNVTVSTYLESANITPIRLAPVPTIPPISHAPVGNYYYTSPITITPSSPVINIYATSVIPYPYEFYIIAIARPGVNASSTAPVVYYSYQAVVAKPALGISSQPYIEVAVQMSGIISLPPGTYTIQMFAVPFSQGPAISEYPASLVFTNVTVE